MLVDNQTPKTNRALEKLSTQTNAKFIVKKINDSSYDVQCKNVLDVMDAVTKLGGSLRG